MASPGKRGWAATDDLKGPPLAAAAPAGPQRQWRSRASARLAGDAGGPSRARRPPALDREAHQKRRREDRGDRREDGCSPAAAPADRYHLAETRPSGARGKEHEARPCCRRALRARSRRRAQRGGVRYLYMSCFDFRPRENSCTATGGDRFVPFLRMVIGAQPDRPEADRAMSSAA